MTKNTKIAAIASAAALLAIGASMTSFAATGWQEEDGTWVYYDRYQDRVTDTWEKSGNNWYYLNGDGEMATDELIEYSDNYYYVDANGAMVTNQWVEMDNSDDDDENAASTVWYYFQNNGKAYKAPSSGKTTFHTINGKKYAFDEDGKMLWGWVNKESSRETGDDAWKNATYYCGSSDDGAQMYNSWGYIHIVDTDDDDDEDQDRWFYFQSNGKKYQVKEEDQETKGFVEKTINGKKYAFDKDGRMLYEFVSASGSDAKPDDENDVIIYEDGTRRSTYEVADGNVKYFRTAEDGARYTKGWFRVVPDKFFDTDDSDENDDNARWFYADGSGKLYAEKIKTINGKKYAFDTQGEMLWGLRYLSFDEDGDLAYWTDEIDEEDELDEWTKVYDYDGLDDDRQVVDVKSGIYYFGDEETDGSMKTGNQTVTVDGDAYTFRFKNSGSFKGVGICGKKDNAYYVNGRKVKADSDDKYDIYVCADGLIVGKIAKSTEAVDYSITSESDKYYGSKSSIDLDDLGDNAYYVVISSSGSLIKSGTKKDGNDVKLVVKDSELIGAYVEK